MSQKVDSNAITGSIDEFDLEYVPSERYWFKLNHLPIITTILFSFEYSNSVMTNECDIIVITKDKTGYDDNVIYIAYTSEECNDYAKCLIGSYIIIDDEKIQITSDNYLSYKYLLEGYIFVDFSRSEQIISILDDLDSSGNRTCNHFTATYFYEL